MQFFDHGHLDIARQNLNRGRYEAAFDIFFDLAVHDLDPEAQFALTKMCFDGHLDADQIRRLFEWMNSNSSVGNGYALFNVGLMYERGMGEIKQDYKTAVEYYEKAIKEEVVDAYCNLGNIYALGLGEEQGIVRDVPRGIQFLAKGAEEGSRQAAYTLGCLYEKGEYIPQNHSKACYYLVLATLAGHDQAHRVLIIFQHTNKGNYNKEFDDAEHQYGKIQNMRKLYKCL